MHFILIHLALASTEEAVHFILIHLQFDYFHCICDESIDA